MNLSIVPACSSQCYLGGGLPREMECPGEMRHGVLAVLGHFETSQFVVHSLAGWWELKYIRKGKLEICDSH